MGYALKLGGEVFPLTRYINPADLLDNTRNTIVYEQEENLHQQVLNLFSTGISVDEAQQNVNQLAVLSPAGERAGPGLRQPLPHHHHALYGCL